VLDEATVEIKYSADIAGPVTSFRLLRRSNPSTPFLEVDTYLNIQSSPQVVQDQFSTSSTSYQYKMESVFRPADCESSLTISESNHGNNILLTNTLNGPIITLTWTPYESYEPGLSGYIIQRRRDGNPFADVATAGPLTTQWQETIQSLINGFQAGEVQYRVIALSNPNGGGIEEQSISNITTVVVETNMQVPNAFTPASNDINAEFRPLMDFAPREYLMIIMDRGGRRMFETTDPEEGWDGRFQGGNYVDEAVYVYYIQYTDYTGLFRTFTGNVTVLYP
jgi:gliding motility-associated-like protein